MSGSNILGDMLSCESKHFKAQHIFMRGKIYNGTDGKSFKIVSLPN